MKHHVRVLALLTSGLALGNTVFAAMQHNDLLEVPGDQRDILFGGGEGINLPIEEVILNQLLVTTQTMNNLCISAAKYEAKNYNLASTDQQAIRNVLNAGRMPAHALIPTFNNMLAKAPQELQDLVNQRMHQLRKDIFGNYQFATVQQALEVTQKFCEANYALLEDIKHEYVK